MLLLHYNNMMTEIEGVALVVPERERSSVRSSNHRGNAFAF